eukprot:5492345-Heterocapsa_arctica.AAC.1
MPSLPSKSPRNVSRDPVSLPQALSPFDPSRSHDIGGAPVHPDIAQQPPNRQPVQVTKRGQDIVEPPLIHELGHNAKGHQSAPLHHAQRSKEGVCPMGTDAIDMQHGAIRELKEQLEKQQQVAQNMYADSQRFA